MSSVAMVCKGIPILFMLTGHMDCKDVRATPEPQKVVCSGPSVPLLTIPEFNSLNAQFPKIVVYLGKNKRNRKDNHCPEMIKP